MNKEEVLFLSKMILDELMEFMVTLVPDYKVQIIKMTGGARDLEFKELTEDELCAEQMDVNLEVSKI